jgi:hypothetical protein
VRAAPSWARCSAWIKLKGGSWAQCKRWRNEGFAHNPDGLSLCNQHMAMYCDGNGIYDWHDDHHRVGWNVAPGEQS